GKGRVFIGSHFDGTRTFEAEDSRGLTLLPIDGAFTECPPGSVDRGYDLDDVSSIGGGTTSPITSVTRDEEGCRVFAVEGTYDRHSTVRVCSPDAAYPFAEADALGIRLDNGSFDLGSMWLIENAQ